MELFALCFSIAAILMFLGWAIRWTFIIAVAAIVIIIALIAVLLLAIFSLAPKKFTSEEREDFIKLEEEKFLKASRNHIYKFIKETNPTFDIKKKYNFGELRELKSRLEANGINVPLLERFISVDSNHAKLLYLEYLIKQEITNNHR